MFRELLSIFRPGNPLQAMADNFAKMLELTHEQTVKAGEIYFSRTMSPESRSEIRRMDVEVNKLERKIRKQVIQRLSLRGTTQQVPYSLLLMSLVKDVERIGDYAKNLSEVVDFSSDPLPDDEITAELREFRKFVETAFGSTAEIFSESDREGAIELITAGRGLDRARLHHHCHHDSNQHAEQRAPFESPRHGPLDLHLHRLPHDPDQQQESDEDQETAEDNQHNRP